MADRDYSKRAMTHYELHAHLSTLEALAEHVPQHVLANRLLDVIVHITKLETPLDNLRAALSLPEAIADYQPQFKSLLKEIEEAEARCERLEQVRDRLQRSNEERHDRIMQLEKELESWRNPGTPEVLDGVLSEEFRSGATRDATVEGQEEDPKRRRPLPPEGAPPEGTGFTATWPKSKPRPEAGDPKFEVFDPSKPGGDPEPEDEVTAAEKTCTLCGQEKPAAEFYKQQKSKDGLHAWCKNCFKRKARERKERKRKEREVQQGKRRLESAEEKVDRAERGVREAREAREVRVGRNVHTVDAPHKTHKIIVQDGPATEAKLEPGPEERGQGKVKARLCARGRLCLHYPEIHGPAPLADGNPGPMCDRCERARNKVAIDHLRHFPNTHPRSAGAPKGIYCSNGKRCAGFSDSEGVGARPTRLSENDGPVCKACLKRAGLE